ncbi:MAG: DEAD/DEAH box helicase family protein [Lachnospiraceae bacterium]|nr:DEAD/DEAH box helicase family protein [Lachnospiraceae bacterium]
MQTKIANETPYQRVMKSLSTSQRLIEIESSDRKIIIPLPPWVRRTEDKVEVFPFSHCFISERLTQGRAEEILRTPSIPVFIDAQTGAGKTTFIFSNLYPLLHMRRKRLLIFVSRSVLKQQVKYDAIKAARTTQIEDLTPSGIEKEHIFGDIEVYTYQDFNQPALRMEVREKLSSGYYGSVVFDECHYFISDADFNYSTQDHFDFLIEAATRQPVTRIYLTATPSYVFDEILEKEKDLKEQSWLLNNRISNPSPLFKYYHFERNYDYLDIEFADGDRIKQILTQSDDKKILLFTDTKQLGKKMEESIKAQSKGKQCFFLDAESLRDSSEQSFSVRNKIIKENELAVDVLIATKCLDVGVTINTKNLIIICYLKDKNDFLQAIGRKRITKSEKVKLVVPAYARKDIDSHIQKLQKSLENITHACETYPDGAKAYGNDFPHPIYIKDGVYQHNAFAQKKLELQLQEYTSLKSDIILSSEPEGKVIARHILSWIGKEKNIDSCLQPEDWSTNESESNESLTNIIKKYRQKDGMDKLTFDCFCEELRPFDQRSDKRKSRQEITTRTANAIFKHYGLPYIISTKGTGSDAIYNIKTNTQEEGGN